MMEHCMGMAYSGGIVQSLECDDAQFAFLFTGRVTGWRAHHVSLLKGRACGSHAV